MLRLSALFLVATLPTAAWASSPLDDAPDPEYGVYLRLVERLDGSVEAVTESTAVALVEAGWEVLAVRAADGPGGCGFEARVLVVHSGGYAAALAPYGPHTAFAVPLRVVVFEDEHGVHVGVLDLRSLNRTIVDERVPGSAWEPWLSRLTEPVRGAFPDHRVEAGYGQMRDEGRIGRTFGIMAGGPFVEKIEVVAAMPLDGASVGEVTTRIVDTFGAGPSGEWGLESVYRVDLPDVEAVVLGVSGGPMEAKAFDIVAHGGDDGRKEMACPGLDHAAAFPVEIVVQRVGDQVEVRLVDEMYRMKMFFEDAGKVAFARNMGMPGSIEDQIRATVEAALGS